MNDDKLKKEYPGLSLISIICKVIGFVVIISAIIGLFKGISLLGGYISEVLGIYFIISSLVGGLLLSVPFFAFAELIKVFVRIEFNTRKNKDDEQNTKLENIIRRKKSENNDNAEISYEDWKMQNPGKTINDYYRERK